MYNLNHDILNIIIPLSTNQNCFLVCRQWYDNFKRNLLRCSTCHKVTKIYDKEIWATDEDDDYCHEYKGSTEEYKVLKDMIKFNPNIFQHIINQTHKLCEIAISETKYNIEHIREEFKDSKICLMIAKSLNFAHHIPKHMFNENLYLEIVKINSGYLSQIPEDKRTYEICLEAVKNCGSILSEISRQTNELCLEAVKKYGSALAYVHDKTFEICMEAIKQNPEALRFVPQEFLNAEICENVVTRSGYMLHYVPKHLRTERVCIVAIKTYLGAMEYVDNQTDLLLNEAFNVLKGNLQRNVYFFEYFHVQPEDICWLILNHNYKHLYLIKNPTEEMCIFCVNKKYKMIKYIKNPNENICMEALKNNIYAINYIRRPTQKMHEYVFSVNNLHKYKRHYDLTQYIKMFKENPDEFKKL
jgi:hypothetical protein